MPSLDMESLNIVLTSIFVLYYLTLTVRKSDFRIPNPDLTSPPPQRLAVFDFIKGISVLAVVGIHLTYFLNQPQSVNNTFVCVNESINRLLRFAIGSFLISSGALLHLPDLKLPSLKNFFLKKIKRILPPYFLASAFLTLVYNNSQSLNLETLVRMGNNLLFGTASRPFYFIPLLFQLYLLYPLIWFLVEKKGISLKHLTVLAFFLSLTSHWQWPNLGKMINPGTYLFYFLLGISLKHPLVKGKRDWLKEININCLWALTSLLYLSISFLKPAQRYYNAHFAYSGVTFLFLYYQHPRISPAVNRFFANSGRRSLLIYLTHFPLMQIFF